jgi:hypothetical protein
MFAKCRFCDRFLGRVIGVAVRSRVQLPFLLAPSFWKAMVCSQASLLDLAAIDTSAAAVLTQLKQARDSTLPFVTMEEHGDPVPGFDDLMWTVGWACMDKVCVWGGGRGQGLTCTNLCGCAA